MSFLKVAAIIAGIILIITVVYVASLLLSHPITASQVVPNISPTVPTCLVIDESITMAEPYKLCSKR